jgi:hypothetical protein
MGNQADRIFIRGVRPLAISLSQASLALGSPRLVQRALFWSLRGQNWLDIVQKGGRGRMTLVSTESVEQLHERRAKGDMPPLLPSETRSGSC